MSLSLDDLKNLSQLGALPLSLIALWVVWKRLVALQTAYETVLKECIAALVRVSDKLDDLDDDK